MAEALSQEGASECALKPSSKWTSYGNGPRWIVVEISLVKKKLLCAEEFLFAGPRGTRRSYTNR